MDETNIPFIVNIDEDVNTKSDEKIYKYPIILYSFYSIIISVAISLLIYTLWTLLK